MVRHKWSADQSQIFSCRLAMSNIKESSGRSPSTTGYVGAAHVSPRRGRPSRREVVTGSLAGMTAAGATALTAIPHEARTEPVADNELGYRETDRVKRYYALARQ